MEEEIVQPFSTQPVGVDPTGDFFNAALDKMSATYNQYKASDKIQYGNVNALDPFQYQENYDPGLFNPADSQNNYSRYSEIETLSSTLGKSFDDFNYKFKSSFDEYWSSYARLGESLFKADLSHLDPEEGELMKAYYDDNLNEMKNKVFMKPEDEDSFFNKQFLKDFLGNAGFSLGTFAAFSLELAFDLGLEAITFGGATPGIVAKDAARLAKFGNAIQDFATGFSMSGRSVDDVVRIRKAMSLTDQTEVAALGRLNLSRDFSSIMKEHLRAVSVDIGNIKKTKGLQAKFMKTLQEMPVIGSIARTADKLAQAGDVMSTGQKIGLTVGGFKRSLSEFNLASSEAAFESVHTYGSTLDNLIQDYKNKNGKNPTGTELLEMKDYAMNAASSNYNTNTAILLISNKIQFGNLMSKFAPTKKLMQDFTEEAAGRIITTQGKNAAGETLRKLYDQKGLVRAFKNFGDMSKTFGKGVASRELGKSLVRSGFQFEVTEGIQENLQETSAVAWEDYYTSMYNREPLSLLNSIGEGLSSQYSEQGLKTFLIGAFTGSITRPVTSVAEKAMEFGSELRYKKGESPRQLADKQTTKDLLLANESLQKEFFNENIFNFKVQQNASAGMTAASSNNNIYEYKNHQTNSMIAAVKTHKRLGTLDTYVENLRDMGKNFSEEEFEQAFKIKPGDTKYGNSANMFNSLADDMETYSKTYDRVKDNLPNILDSDIIDATNRLKTPQIFYWNVMNDAADVIAFNYIKSEDAIKRIHDITNDIMSMPNVSQSSDFITRVLTNPENLRAHVATLDSEIQNLEKMENRSADLTKQLNLKKDEIDLIEKWAMLIHATEEEEQVDVTLPDGTKEKRTRKKIVGWQANISAANNTRDEKLLRDIINLKNKQSGINVSVSETVGINLLQKVADYINLDKDAKDYLNTVDALANPKEFKKMISRMLDGKFKSKIGIALNTIYEQLLDGFLKDRITLDQKDAIENDPLIEELEVLYLSTTVGYEAIGRIDIALKQFYDKYKKELGHEPTVKKEEEEAETAAGADPEVVTTTTPTAEEIKSAEAAVTPESNTILNTIVVPPKFANLSGVDLVNAILRDKGIEEKEDPDTGLPSIDYNYENGTVYRVSLTEDKDVDTDKIVYDVITERVVRSQGVVEEMEKTTYPTIDAAKTAYENIKLEEAIKYAKFIEPTLVEVIKNVGQAEPEEKTEEEKAEEEAKEKIPETVVTTTSTTEPGTNVTAVNLDELLFSVDGNDVVNQNSEVVLTAETPEVASKKEKDMSLTKEELDEIKAFIKTNTELVGTNTNVLEIGKRYKNSKAQSLKNFLNSWKKTLKKEKMGTFTEVKKTEEKVTPKNDIIDNAIFDNLSADTEFTPKPATDKDIADSLEDLANSCN